MIQRMQPLVEQLMEAPGKAEIICGEIVGMSPAGIRHNRGAGAIYSSLLKYEAAIGGGYAFTDNAGFIVDLPERESFSPDVAWFAGELDERDMDFVAGPPTFAVEVRSKRDYGAPADAAIASKIAEYFAAGTLVVWDVDLKSDRVITCYRASEPATPIIFYANDIANAEPAVPGWQFPVSRLLRR